MNRLTKVLLVLALEIILFMPAMLKSNVDRGSKSLDEYWAETDLTASEIEALLASNICYADKISFLSCVNAVEQMAERYNIVLSEQIKFQSISKVEIERRSSEKTELSFWTKIWDKKYSKLNINDVTGKESSAKPSFVELWQQLQKKYVRDEQLESVLAAGLNGYLSVAKDPHSYIIPISFYDEVISKSDSRINILGFIARRTKTSAYVRKVFEGSPAGISGLRKGDRILRVNGVEVLAMLPNQFADILKLKDNDRLGVLIERWYDNKRFEKYIEIVKSDFIAPSVSSTMLHGSQISTQEDIRKKDQRLGLITLNKFAKDTCKETRTQLLGLIEQGAQGILIDVRDNPGGQVEEAACIINLFVDQGTPLFETRYLDFSTPIDRYIAEKKPIYKGPLVVLVNSGSASASEIVAGALKDIGRATLVGERTFGKGSFQDGRMWGAHSKIALFETQGMYYFPSGWTPQLVGIEPDIKVEFTDIDGHREGELFFNPLVPRDLWNGPQALTWIQLMQCQDNVTLWENLGEHSGEDPQLIKAREWLNCKNKLDHKLGITGVSIEKSLFDISF